MNERDSRIAQVTSFYKKPNSDDVIVDLDPMELKTIGTCCICNSNYTMCIPEQYSGHFVTSAVAHSVSYYFT